MENSQKADNMPVARLQNVFGGKLFFVAAIVFSALALFMVVFGVVGCFTAEGAASETIIDLTAKGVLENKYITENSVGFLPLFVLFAALLGAVPMGFFAFGLWLLVLAAKKGQDTFVDKGLGYLNVACYLQLVYGALLALAFVVLAIVLLAVGLTAVGLIMLLCAIAFAALTAVFCIKLAATVRAARVSCFTKQDAIGFSPAVSFIIGLMMGLLAVCGVYLLINGIISGTFLVGAAVLLLCAAEIFCLFTLYRTLLLCKTAEAEAAPIEE